MQPGSRQDNHSLMGASLVSEMEVDNWKRQEVSEEVRGLDRTGGWKYLEELTEENDCVSIDWKVMSYTPWISNAN